MEKAIEHDPSTEGMVRATVDANAKWEIEIKKTLKLLKKGMSPHEWEALEHSQQCWEIFKAAELKTQAEIFSRIARHNVEADRCSLYDDR